MSAPTLFQLSYALLWILALVLIPISIVLLYLLAQLQPRSRLLLHDETKMIGRKMPALSASELSSGVVRQISEFRGLLHVVLVLSPDCGPCLRLMEEIKSTSRGDPTQFSLLLLCKGQFERCRAVVGDIQGFPVLAFDATGAETAGLWLAGVPATIIVDDAGTVVDVRHPASFGDVIAAVESTRTRGGGIAEQERGMVVPEAASSA